MKSGSREAQKCEGWWLRPAKLVCILAKKHEGGTEVEEKEEERGVTHKLAIEGETVMKREVQAVLGKDLEP